MTSHFEEVGSASMRAACSTRPLEEVVCSHECKIDNVRML